MKLILIIGVLSLWSGIFACSLQNRTVAADKTLMKTELTARTAWVKTKPPVLVELFTSEGCSDCPSADRVLARLQTEQPNADAEIITLALHVDYWDRLGWKDQFSSRFYSERQNEYADRFKMDSIYTPQMVVDGEKEFVGSNFPAAQNAISAAAKNQKANIEISSGADTKSFPKNIRIKISDLPAHENSDVWLAIAEDNLQTSVKRGENSGKTLSHISVARQMTLLGEINSTDKTFETAATPNLRSNWNERNLKFVVFVQGKNTKRVYGVNKKSAV